MALKAISTRAHNEVIVGRAHRIAKYDQVRSSITSFSKIKYTNILLSLDQKRIPSLGTRMSNTSWQFPFFPNSAGREDAKYHTQELVEWVNRMVELHIEASRDGHLTKEDEATLARVVEEAVTQAKEFEAHALTPSAKPHPHSHMRTAEGAALDIAEKILDKENSA